MDGNAPCPACGLALPLPPDAVVGEILVCGYCGAELEIVGLAPVVLEFFEEEEK